MDSHLPIVRLSDRLERLSGGHMTALTVGTVILLALVDRRYPGVGIDPLYLPVICIACWSLGWRMGYAVAIVAGVLTALPHMVEVNRLGILTLSAKIAVRVVSFLFVAGVVASFRSAFDRQRHRADRDSLTGALNKGVFRGHVVRRLGMAQRTGQTLILSILDLDDFKAINTDHGHGAGDEVLQILATGALEAIRSEDGFGRIGGDEFALLTTVSDIEEGYRCAIALHKRLSTVLAAAPCPVTCSMGALLIQPQAARDEAMLMRAVDRLMYAVKHAGKNAVRVGEVRADDA